MAGEGSALVKAYLFTYNLVQFLGWLYCFVLTVLSLIRYGLAGFPAVLEHVRPVYFFQGLAALEILHSMLGLVRSPVFTTATQVIFRDIVLFPILAVFPKDGAPSPATFLLILAWSGIEIIRYPLYMLDVIGAAPSWLLWLRYTAFIPLYPVGFVTELAVLYSSLPIIRDTGRYSLVLPNPYNFEFSMYYYLFAHMSLYLYGAPTMFLYMLKQRKRKLGRKSSVAKTE